MPELTRSEYQPGVYEGTVRQFTGDVSGAKTELDVSAVTDPNAVVIMVQFMSLDGGVTWRYNGLAVHLGGPVRPADGKASFETQSTASEKSPMYKTVVAVINAPAEFAVLDSVPVTETLTRTR